MTGLNEHSVCPQGSKNRPDRLAKSPEKSIGAGKVVCQVHASPSQAVELTGETNPKPDPEVQRGKHFESMLENFKAISKSIMSVPSLYSKPHAAL
jgi:hypothetical protein